MSEPTAKVEFANTLRGLAAVFVMISHYFGVFWERPEAVAALILAPELPVTVPGYLAWLHLVPQFDWGYLGVCLFFLISGFVIPFSFRNATWGSFLVGRFFRIWPLYAAGFSITLLALWLSTRLHGAPWPFEAEHVLVQPPRARSWSSVSAAVSLPARYGRLMTAVCC